MPGARLPMRKIRDMLRLTAAGMSSRKIAASLSIGGTTVVDCLRRARAVGVGWPLPEDLSDAALEARLFPASMALAAIKSRRTQADWPAIHRELKRPGVTLQLVWEEHRTAHPEGYGYSRFCELFRTWEGRLSPTMRQTHVAGEKLFVDYAGTTLDVIDGTTGELRSCSSPRSGRRATPGRKRRGRRGSAIGSARTRGRSCFSAASLRCWCRTISSPASPRRASTSRR
jgi:hypothetical protein